MKYEKYLIKKEKLDLLSSLKLLDKKIVNEKLKELIDNAQVSLRGLKDNAKVFDELIFDIIIYNSYS